LTQPTEVSEERRAKPMLEFAPINGQEFFPSSARELRNCTAFRRDFRRLNRQVGLDGLLNGMDNKLSHAESHVYCERIRTESPSKLSLLRNFPPKKPLPWALAWF
jgi:hypothetical protein